MQRTTGKKNQEWLEAGHACLIDIWLKTQSVPTLAKVVDNMLSMSLHKLLKVRKDVVLAFLWTARQNKRFPTEIFSLNIYVLVYIAFEFSVLAKEKIQYNLM